MDSDQPVFRLLHQLPEELVEIAAVVVGVILGQRSQMAVAKEALVICRQRGTNAALEFLANRARKEAAAAQAAHINHEHTRRRIRGLPPVTEPT